MQQQGQDTAARDAFFSNPQMMESLQPWSTSVDDGLLPRTNPQRQHPPLRITPPQAAPPAGKRATGGSGVPSGAHGSSVNADPAHGSVSPTTTSSSNQTPLNQAAMLDTAQPLSPPAGNLSAGTQQPVQTTESATGSLSGPVATFRDADGNTDPNKYTVSVDFGNGGHVPTIVSYSNGVFSVNTEGSPYTEEGTYNIVTTVNDSDGDYLQINNTAQVADAALTGQSGGSQNGTAGQAIPFELGSFTDANTGSTTADFTVSVNWGDGTAPTGANLTGGNGSYGVNGSHVYAQPGTYHVVATVTDDGGKSVQLTGTANIALPAAPVANPDSYSVVHDSTVGTSAGSGVLANDTGVGDTAAVVTGPLHGSLTLNPNGSFLYTPAAHYTGSDSFTYKDTDGFGQTSNTATVNLSVTDQAPVAANDSYTGLHDQTIFEDASTGVLANDSDADNDSLTAQLVSGPTHGSLALNSDGSFSYTPNAGYVGSDSFVYKDSDGVLSSSNATVTLTLTDQAPAVQSLSYGIPENTSESVVAAQGVLAKATDADGDPLTASKVSGPSHGTLTLNPDGSFTYVPTTGYTGTDSFQYSASDGAESSTATVTLNMHGTDSAPVANAASYSLLHDQAFSATAANGVISHASDSDSDPLTTTQASGPAHGSLTLNPDGSFTYTPNAGYVGTDSFSYTVSDGSKTSAAATVTLNVSDPNPPVGVADSYTVERNNEFDANTSIGVLANDTDADGDTLTATVASQPAHGTLTLNSDGSFSYIPTTGYTGSDSFTYTASDGAESTSPVTVSLTVSASAPTAANQTFAVAQNTSLAAPSGTLLLNDSNPDNMSLTTQDVSQPQHGTVTVNSDGSFTYTPTTGYTGADSFAYQLSDGGLTSTPATVNLPVKSSDTAPTAANVSFSLNHDTTLSTDSSGGVLSGASDSDGDPLLATLVSGPADGSLTFNPDGSFVYTPNAGYFGTDSFTFKAFDGTSYSAVATATLTVTNDAPTAVASSDSVLPTGTTSVSAANGVLANDSDGENDPLTAVLVSQAAHGTVTLNSDGSFSYTPGGGFTGSDSFTYEAYDGVNYSSPATVTLTTAPVAQAQTYAANHDTPQTVDNTTGLLTGAVDADGDKLTAALATGPSDGTVTVNSDGSFTYTPATHYTGTDSFTYTVSDGTQTSATATVTLNVSDSVPTVNPRDWDTPENTALTVNGTSGVLYGAFNNGGDTFAAELVSCPANGTVQLNSSGAFVYTPNTGFSGTDTFQYAASDGVSTSSPATVSIQVNQTIADNLSGSVPSAMATGDFNGDGNPDVIMADKGLNTVLVYLDGSNGVVANTPVSTTTVGQAPVALAVGDFNGDGKQDLAVANSGSNSVSILLGTGTGSFTTGTTLTGFSDPVAVVAGDFNGDGKTDLAVVNQGSNSVSVLLGNGNGTFTSATSLTTGSSPTSVAAADFNNDGKTDLVVTNSGSNTVSVFLSNGNGTFAAPLSDAVGTAPASVAVGDFNGDGKEDLAVANSGSNNVSVLLGNGDGTFQSAVNYAVGSDPVAIATGQFDGDGYLDLSVANRGSSTLTNLLNEGNGTFLVHETEAVKSDPVGIAVADFNHDGLADQAVALADPGPYIQAGTLNGAFHPALLAVSSNGKEIAGAGRDAAGDTFIVVWDAASGVRTTILTSTVMVTGIAFSAGGDYLAVATWDARNREGYITMYSLKKPYGILYELPVGPAETKFLRPATGHPMSVAFDGANRYLAVTDTNGDLETWKDPLGKLASGAIYTTPATGSGAGLQPSQAFFMGNVVAGGFTVGYQTHDLTGLLGAHVGTASFPPALRRLFAATAYTGLIQPNVGTLVLAMGFNTGEVEFDTLAPRKIRSIDRLHNVPVIDVAFPALGLFAKANSSGISFYRFSMTSFRATPIIGAAAPEGTTLVTMASPMLGIGGPTSAFVVAAFSDGRIIKFNPVNGVAVQTILNSSSTE